MEFLQREEINLFEESYAAYFPLLYNYAFNITRNREIAEDVVADIFLKFWEDRNSVVIEKSLKSYLFKGVHNQCLNQLRRQKVQKGYEDFIKHLLLLTDDDVGYPLSELIASELDVILKQSIDKLPPQCRKIFEMSRDRGLTHSEIAIELGISVNTVHTQIRRALEKLRIELKDFLPLLLYFILRQMNN